MDRRRAVAALGLLLLVVLAGCSAAGSLDMEPATDDTELAESASRSTTLPDEGPTRDRKLVRQAIENGSATARGRHPPVEGGLPFAHEGRYYDLTRTVVDRQPGTAAEVAIDYNGTAASGETVPYEELSVRDRDAVDELLPPRTDRRNEGYDFGVGIMYNETERNRPVLLAGEYEAISYEGDTYPVGVDGTESVTIETYRYTASVVANDSAAYADRLRERYLFTLSGLSEEERQVVETAIDETYYAEATDDEAFRSVLETFQRHEAVQQNEYEGSWLVRYDGTVYLADLSHGGFDDSDGT